MGAVLGAGNFGITYLAFDTMLNQKVAIKNSFRERLQFGKMQAVIYRQQTDRKRRLKKGSAGFKQEASLSFGDFDIPAFAMCWTILKKIRRLI